MNVDQIGIFSEKRLLANLRAIALNDPQMTQRLCWPVNSSHVRLIDKSEDMPVAEINYRDSWYKLCPFDNPRQNAFDTITSFYRNNDNSDILIFGVGLGYYVEALLAQLSSDQTIHLYDRDPWLMRLMLMRLDLSPFIYSGNIRLHLGSDLQNLRFQREKMRVFLHPVLSLMYHNEREFFEDKDFKHKNFKILLGEGTLFVDDVAAVLRNMGHDVLPWLPKHVSTEELSFQLKDFSPDVVFQINYINGIAEFLEQHQTKLICWEIDPVIDRITGVTGKNENVFIFTYNPQYSKHYLEAGLRNVEYLPLGTNTLKRKPLNLTPEQRQKYGSKVSFVGASMVKQAKTLESVFDKIPPAFFGGEGKGKTADCIFHEILEEQSLDRDVYRIPEILANYLEPGRKPFFNYNDVNYDVEMLLGETAAVKRRIDIVSCLAPYGIHLWGDAGWEMVAPQDGIYYRGYAGHHSELNYIYNATDINLDINRFFQTHIVTMRVFDVLACGGFILAEHNQALTDLFDVDHEIISYKSINELKQSVNYYLEHPEKRKEVSQAGRETVLKRHDIKYRVAYMLKTAGL